MLEFLFVLFFLIYGFISLVGLNAIHETLNEIRDELNKLNKDKNASKT